MFGFILEWHFASVPHDISENIKQHFGDMKRGWVSLHVVVTMGKTSSKTSIFPDKEKDGYLLPLKTEVRKKEGIVADSSIFLLLEIRI